MLQIKWEKQKNACDFILFQSKNYPADGMKNLTLVEAAARQAGSSILVEQWSYLGASSNYVLCQDYMVVDQPSTL